MPASFDAIATSQRSAWRTVFFGVGGKLQIAFSFVAGLTALSTIVSLLCFSAVEVGLRDFVTREMPVVTTVVRLSVISGEISAAAARLINARTADEQRTIGALIAQKRGDVASSLQQLQKLDGGQPAMSQLLACVSGSMQTSRRSKTSLRNAARFVRRSLPSTTLCTVRTRGWRNALRSFRSRVRRLKWPRTAISWST
jgi:phosphoglycerate-specific signal transduction histidine kinase